MVNQIGKKGEDLAVNFLQNLGYKIIDRNFRIRGGEIDIVAIDDKTLVYAEVKTRTSNRFGEPQEAVDWRKIKFLERAAKFWRNDHAHSSLPDNERIDVVAINMQNKQKPQFNHIQNITL